MASPPAAAAGPTAVAPQYESGEELIHFIETAQICLFGINLEGKVNAWNSRVEELMGKKSKDVMGKTLYDVLSDSNETPVETRTEVSEPLKLQWGRNPALLATPPFPQFLSDCQIYPIAAHPVVA